MEKGGRGGSLPKRLAATWNLVATGPHPALAPAPPEATRPHVETLAMVRLGLRTRAPAGIGGSRRVPVPDPLKSQCDGRVAGSRPVAMLPWPAWVPFRLRSQDGNDDDIQPGDA